MFVVKEYPTLVGGGDVQDLGPVAAVIEVEAGGVLVSGADPDIEFGTRGAGLEDRVEGVGGGGADLTGFFPDAEGPRVGEPGGLGGKAPGLLGEVELGRVDSS